MWDWGWILGGDVCLSDDDDDDEDEYRCRKEEIGLVCLCGNEKIWPALGGGGFVMVVMRVGSAREIVSVSLFVVVPVY